MIKLTPKEVFGAGHNLRAPFILSFSTGENCLVESVLRILPGKRVVAKIVRDGKPELLKLFRHAKNIEDELRGYQALQKSQIRTPVLLTQQIQEDSSICTYRFLTATETFDCRWQRAIVSDGSIALKNKLLDQLLDLIGQLFTAGLKQEDLHPGNFIFEGDDLYALDPASYTTLTSETEKHKNLALLVAQFEWLERAFVIQAVIRNFPAINKDALEISAQQQWQKRKKRYLEKVFRDCSEISAIRKNAMQALCKRNHLTGQLLLLIEKPDAAIQSGRIIKSGRSTTVASVQVDGKNYVIKRYHNDSVITALRRRFGKNRADNNWYFAHLLLMLGISTPQPIALIKISSGLLDYSSYYISEQIDADNAYDVFTRSSPTGAQLKAICKTFTIWRQAGIAHGDCKTTNWLVRGNEAMIVDLDAMREKKKPGTIDVERFLRDWKNHPALFSLFERAIKAESVL